MVQAKKVKDVKFRVNFKGKLRNHCETNLSTTIIFKWNVSTLNKTKHIILDINFEILSSYKTSIIALGLLLVGF